MNISQRLTRAGLTFLVFGAGASFVPGLDTAVLGADTCPGVTSITPGPVGTPVSGPVTIVGGTGISVTNDGPGVIKITNTDPYKPNTFNSAAVLGQVGSNLAGNSIGDGLSNAFGGRSRSMLAHRKTRTLKTAQGSKVKAAQNQDAQDRTPDKGASAQTPVTRAVSAPHGVAPRAVQKNTPVSAESNKIE